MGRVFIGLALGCVSCTFGGAGAGGSSNNTFAGSSDGTASSEGGATTSPSGGESGPAGSGGAADDVSNSIDGDETTGGDHGATSNAATTTSTDTTAGDGDDAPPGNRCGDGVPADDEACDDANDDELDGCTSACERGPTAVVLGDVDETGPFGGSASGSLDEDTDCGANQVLTGLRVEFSQYLLSYYVLGRVAAICAPIALTNATPTAVGFGPTSELAVFGNTSGDGYTLTCPPNAAVSGLFGAAGLYTDVLSIRCRSLAVNKAQDTVVLGAATADGPAGEDGGSPQNVDCAGDRIAAGYRIQGDDRATRFRLRCRRPNILTE
ncbi:MAG: DUF4215 domain-containing protein [Nannocystaceae bacterium]|nr:DUF4215 domain-containing protein [Nannocystaceae bacterium]